MFFIDPPYNAKSTFGHYDDNLEYSQWLSLLYPRLELLSEDGSALSYKVVNESDVITFNQGFTDIAENNLVPWLDRELRQADVMQKDLIKFIVLLVKTAATTST